MTEKKSCYFAYNAIKQTEKMALISTLDGSNWLTEKRTQSIHALKFD
jgi:hypothetical protein